jgi:hypothetical protein
MRKSARAHRQVCVKQKAKAESQMLAFKSPSQPHGDDELFERAPPFKNLSAVKTKIQIHKNTRKTAVAPKTKETDPQLNFTLNNL